MRRGNSQDSKTLARLNRRSRNSSTSSLSPPLNSSSTVSSDDDVIEQLKQENIVLKEKLESYENEVKQLNQQKERLEHELYAMKELSSKQAMDISTMGELLLEAKEELQYYKIESTQPIKGDDSRSRTPIIKTPFSAVMKEPTSFLSRQRSESIQFEECINRSIDISKEIEKKETEISSILEGLNNLTQAPQFPLDQTRTILNFLLQEKKIQMERFDRLQRSLCERIQLIDFKLRKSNTVLEIDTVPYPSVEILERLSGTFQTLLANLTTKRGANDELIQSFYSRLGSLSNKSSTTICPQADQIAEAFRDSETAVVDMKKDLTKLYQQLNSVDVQLSIVNGPGTELKSPLSTSYNSKSPYLEPHSGISSRSFRREGGEWEETPGKSLSSLDLNIFLEESSPNVRERSSINYRVQDEFRQSVSDKLKLLIQKFDSSVQSFQGVNDGFLKLQQLIDHEIEQRQNLQLELQQLSEFKQVEQSIANSENQAKQYLISSEDQTKQYQEILQQKNEIINATNQELEHLKQQIQKLSELILKQRQQIQDLTQQLHSNARRAEKDAPKTKVTSTVPLALPPLLPNESRDSNETRQSNLFLKDETSSKQEIEELKAQLAKLQSDVVNVSRELAEKEKELKERDRQFKEVCQQIESAKTKLASLQEQVKGKQRSLQDLAAGEKSLDNMKLELINLKSQVEAKKQELDSAEQHLKDIQGHSKLLLDQMSHIETDKHSQETLQYDYRTWKKLIEEKKNLLTQLRHEEDQLLKHKLSLEKTIQIYKDEEAHYERKKRQLLAHLGDLRQSGQQLFDASKDLHKLNEDFEKLKSEILQEKESLTFFITQKQNSIQQLSQEIARLKAGHNQTQSSSVFNILSQLQSEEKALDQSLANLHLMKNKITSLHGQTTDYLPPVNQNLSSSTHQATEDPQRQKEKADLEHQMDTLKRKLGSSVPLIVVPKEDYEHLKHEFIRSRDSTHETTKLFEMIRLKDELLIQIFHEILIISKQLALISFSPEDYKIFISEMDQLSSSLSLVTPPLTSLESNNILSNQLKLATRKLWDQEIKIANKIKSNEQKVFRLTEQLGQVSQTLEKYKQAINILKAQVTLRSKDHFTSIDLANTSNHQPSPHHSTSSN